MPASERVWVDTTFTEQSHRIVATVCLHASMCCASPAINKTLLFFLQASRLDIAECIGIPITLVFLPAQDIATYVGEGNVDMGITGSDIVQESGESGNIDTVLQLGFGKCSLCVQAPIPSKIKDPSTLVGKRIATSYPHLTQQYFATFRG